MAAPALVLKAAASILANEKSRKAVGWVLIAVLSPIILLLAFFCTTFSGGAEHNRTVADLCFHGGAVPEGTPEEYQAYIQEMRDSFVLLDAAMQTVEGQMEDGDGLDDVRVKAVFFALYFGADDPAAHAGQAFVDCFVTYEERTRTVTTVDEEGNEVETQETYTVAVSISDFQQVWQNIRHLTGAEATPEQQANADSVYNVVKYGASTGTEGWIPGTDVPFIGADGFCSPHWGGLGEPGHLGVWLPEGPLHRGDPGSYRHGFGGTHRHPRPGRPARHRHRRPVPQQLRLLCDDRPW